MFSSLTYRQKNRLLLVGFVVFLFLAYQLSIGETFKLMSEKTRIERQLQRVGTAPAEIGRLQRKLSALDANLGSGGNQADFQQQLLENVTAYCQDHRLNLSSFPKPYLTPQKGYQLETYACELEGPFAEALGLIYAVEQDWKIGKTVSADFRVEKNYRTGARKLYTTVYIQAIKTL